jgi:hypothetical protein
MGVNITEPRQTYIQSNAEAEAKPMVAVAWSSREARRSNWEEERLVSHLVGGFQNIEKEGKCSDIEKREKGLTL